MKTNISDMTLEQKIGQMILAGFQGTELNDNVIKLIKNYNAGNIILFSRNITSSEQLFTLNREMQSLALSENNIPLFIASDEEGGSVSRVNNAGYFFPGAMTLSSGGNSKDAFRLGELLGKKLSSLGININLAPVLDISTNPAHPTLNSRGYSDKPEVVSEMATAFIRGLQDNNVISVAKHFPGHGHSFVDTHLEKDVVDLDEERLHRVELMPFISAIKSGIVGMMSSHVIFSAYDDLLPSTLSKNILSGLLRDELGFNGLVFSDCLEMKAVSQYFGIEETALMAVKAGVDILIISHSFDRQVKCIQRLLKAVNEGEISEERINESVTRILKYKAKYFAERLIETDFESDKEKQSNYELSRFIEGIYRKSITVIKGSENFPIEEANSLLIYTEAVNLSLVDDSIKGNIAELMIKRFPRLELAYFPLSADEDLINEIIARSRDKKSIVVLTYNAYHNASQTELVNKLIKINPETIVISMRNPYDILKFPAVRTYAITYEYTPPSMEAVAMLLSGEITGNNNCPAGLSGHLTQA